MPKKKSFVLYNDYINHIDKLSDEEAGQLFKAIFHYVEFHEEPELSDKAEMAFSFISAQLSRDLEKWENVKQKRAEAGRKGGRNTQANRANASFAKQNQADQAVNDTVNVNDNVNVNGNDNEIRDDTSMAGETDKPSQPSSLFHSQAEEIISFLNLKAGTLYRPESPDTQQYIIEKLKEGFTVDNFKTVIYAKCREWLKEPKMRRYLRPSTLFGDKFESYLNSGAKEREDDFYDEKYKQFFNVF